MSERTVRLERTREALAALASAIKSGEPFTEEMVVAILDAGEELERAEAALEASRKLLAFDLHATQHIIGMTHDGHDLRAIHVEDVDAIIAAQAALRAALAAVGSGEGDTT